jgi:hypothetical protein
MLCTLAYSPSKLCNAPLTTNGLRVFDEEIPTSRWCDAAPHGRHKSDKELPLLALFLPITMVSTLFGQECHDMGRQACPYHSIWGLPRLG